MEVTDAEIREIVGEKTYEQYQELTFKNYIDTNADTAYTIMIIKFLVSDSRLQPLLLLYRR